jgi:AAA+ ATPase superfamily predicted ATPase
MGRVLACLKPNRSQPVPAVANPGGYGYNLYELILRIFLQRLQRFVPGKAVAQFVDRRREFQELGSVLQKRGAHFIAAYGRRQVGKTVLILNWVRHTGQPHLFWVARRRDTADAARLSLAQNVWRWTYPDTPDPQPQHFDSWSLLFEHMARMIGNQPLIVIFDEFPYAVESGPSLSSHLQASRDHHLKDKPTTLILAGSHIGIMVDLLHYPVSPSGVPRALPTLSFEE